MRPSVRKKRALAVGVIVTIFSIWYLRTHGGSLDSLSLSSPPLPQWSQLPERYPVSSTIPLPTGKPVSIPQIQAKPKSENTGAKTERLRRRAAVQDSFMRSWKSYKSKAWMKDELAPLSGEGKDTFGGWGVTLVDALDTLWIMDMKEDFEAAVGAIGEIDFTRSSDNIINVFETTIRYLGGFLGAYDLSGGEYPLLLQKATEIGDLLMGAFDTPNRMPVARWDWQAYMAKSPQTAPETVLLAELGSLSVEFTRLSQLTGNSKYYDAVQRISDVLDKAQNTTRLPGMWPVMVNAKIPSFDGDNRFQLGGMADSVYEYLPKQYLMLGGLLEQPKRLYLNFIDVAKRDIFFRPLNPDDLDILISGDLRVLNSGHQLTTTGQHLGCFLGGMLGIASRIFERSSDFDFAESLTNGCVWAYDSQVTGIAPEIFVVARCLPGELCLWSKRKWYEYIKDPATFDSRGGRTYDQAVEAIIAERQIAPGFIDVPDRRYILRPEAIESVFVMYRLTADPKWQDKAWRMFEAIERATKTGIASSAIADVTASKTERMDQMESFWLAETLKYFYLIFSDMDLVSLDDYVLNTEAHPLKRPGR